MSRGQTFQSSYKEINGKAVIASGNVGFTCAFGSNPIKVNKVFGLLVKENDRILKFRLIVEQIPPKKKVHGSLHGLRFNLDSDSDNETKNSDVVVQISLIYLSDENIDCRIRHKSANSSDKIIKHCFTKKKGGEKEKSEASESKSNAKSPTPGSATTSGKDGQKKDPPNSSFEGVKLVSVLSELKPNNM